MGVIVVGKIAIEMDNLCSMQFDERLQMLWAYFYNKLHEC